MSIAEAILAARQWMREPDRGVDKPGRKDQIVPSNFGNQRMANDMCPHQGLTRDTFNPSQSTMLCAGMLVTGYRASVFPPIRIVRTSKPGGPTREGASPVGQGAEGFVSLAVADFNGDHKRDLVFANDLDNTVSVLLGNGDGRDRFAEGFLPCGWYCWLSFLLYACLTWLETSERRETA
jgi:hypothetical protein